MYFRKNILSFIYILPICNCVHASSDAFMAEDELDIPIMKSSQALSDEVILKQIGKWSGYSQRKHWLTYTSYFLFHVCFSILIFVNAGLFPPCEDEEHNNCVNPLSYWFTISLHILKVILGCLSVYLHMRFFHSHMFRIKRSSLHILLCIHIFSLLVNAVVCGQEIVNLFMQRYDNITLNPYQKHSTAMIEIILLIICHLFAMLLNGLLAYASCRCYIDI